MLSILRKRPTTIAITIVGRVIAIRRTIKKRSHEAMYKKWGNEVKSDKFSHRKVGRPITKWGAKYNIAIAIMEN